jgi:hypothetical protein
MDMASALCARLVQCGHANDLPLSEEKRTSPCFTFSVAIDPTETSDHNKALGVRLFNLNI